MKAILLLGAPGAGKGTVAEWIKKNTSYEHIATGDMLREAIQAKRPLGLEAKAFMEKGALVPDSLIMQIVNERMAERGPDAQYLFDGFPRTMEQAKLLDQVLKEHGTSVSLVILLDVPRAVIIERLTGRRVCRKCGAVYHIKNIPPRVAGICDACKGNDLYQRPDDTEATIVKRLEVYEAQTASLIDYYKNKGVLKHLKGDVPREKIQEAVQALLKEKALC